MPGGIGAMAERLHLEPLSDSAADSTDLDFVKQLAIEKLLPADFDLLSKLRTSDIAMGIFDGARDKYGCSFAVAIGWGSRDGMQLQLEGVAFGRNFARLYPCRTQEVVDFVRKRFEEIE